MIYCGTFSKTLAPALRIGFAIVPAPLVPAFVRLRTLSDRGTDAFTQATLAEFMRLGLLSPHIRKMRTEYGRRREALLEAMARHVRHAIAAGRSWRLAHGGATAGRRSTRPRPCEPAEHEIWRCRRCAPTTPGRRG